MGFLDFAGGTVVHITAGCFRPRPRDYPRSAQRLSRRERMDPSNIPMVLLGAGILWFGWFGFNAGSALTSGGWLPAPYDNLYCRAAAR